MPIADFKRSYAIFERNNLSNNSLASMVGAGKCQSLFKDTTDKVTFSDLVVDRFLDEVYWRRERAPTACSQYVQHPW